MTNPVSAQLVSFWAALIFGLGAGAGYALLGLLRRRGRFWRGALADAVFWALCAPAVWWFLLAVEGGELRGYTAAAMLLGGAAAGTAGRLLFRPRPKLRKKRRG
ncbi:MAG: hypothetical protein IJL69_03140 [Oscillospiraceae bacterium]|nr:hypothetical protein [Oscillospiraceae bacterium]